MSNLGAYIDMGEENNIFSGASRLFLAPKDTAEFKELPIVENSVSIEEDDLWKSKMPPMQASYSFDCSILDESGMGNLVEHWFNEAIGKPFEAALCVTSKPFINRPKNLKYPNKKRARRIWNKWRNRYGVKPMQEVLMSNAMVSVEPILKDGHWQYRIVAESENNR